MPKESGLVEDKPKWTVTLNGGEWGTVRYGVIEYLRKRPKMRVATAVAGIIWMLGWLASTSGYHWHFVFLPAISALFVTPTLLWFAVVSGPEFGLAFEEKKAPPLPATQPEKNAVLDPEGYGIDALNKSFVSTEACGRGSFRWAMFALIAGILFGCVDVLLSSGILRVSFDRALPVVIWTLVGTMFVLCVFLLVRSMLYFRRATAVQDKLLDFQKTITAIKYLERSKEAPPQIDPVFVLKLLSRSKDLAGGD